MRRRGVTPLGGLLACSWRETLSLPRLAIHPRVTLNTSMLGIPVFVSQRIFISLKFIEWGSNSLSEDQIHRVRIKFTEGESKSLSEGHP